MEIIIIIIILIIIVTTVIVTVITVIGNSGVNDVDNNNSKSSDSDVDNDNSNINDIEDDNSNIIDIDNYTSNIDDAAIPHELSRTQLEKLSNQFFSWVLIFVRISISVIYRLVSVCDYMKSINFGILFHCYHSTLLKCSKNCYLMKGKFS